MDNDHILQLVFFSFLLLRSISAADYGCQPASCAPNEPLIRFPFRIIDRQPSGCGFPGFHLYCNKQNRTIVRLPSSRSYIVNRIDYLSQVIYIDQDFCQQNEINDLNLTGTPFELASLHRYTFYNCSVRNFGFMYPATRFSCLNSTNHSVIAVRTELFSPRTMPFGCKVMKTISVSVPFYGEIGSETELLWFNRTCSSCENEGRIRDCGPEDRQSGCLGSSSNGIPTSAKYVLTLGIGVPASICLIGVICYAASKARNYSETETHHQSIDFFSISIIPRPPSRTGLDGATIESYPKTMLGESCRLPNDDKACVICLSDYKAKESLRTIPECNHYFHADCIDEWLRLNATCPVCRNTPQSSSLVTPCSSTSMTSVEPS
ncbi:hypothetical protein M8C21_026075 [Ambrosia artemisiifolia]|uniref:RING-type E3 ubiquitin transferase n=1 Tax=Ambrosia artemisiifolia TaxID=4212 RepID=A0AAD5G236_AMBAR|nr:hypothetical protein M8C21_026075 [Ambrosia artemisiifolia]